MWVPVAVWQPCELLYTCYLLTYLLLCGSERQLSGAEIRCWYCRRQQPVRLLGVDISLDLSVSRVCVGCFYRMHQLWHIQWSLDSDSLATLIYAVVNSRMHYCNTVLAGAPRTVTDKLQHMLNAAARVITGTRKRDRGLGQTNCIDLTFPTGFSSSLQWQFTSVWTAVHHRICRSTASRSPVLTSGGICVPPTITYLPYRVSGSTLTAIGPSQLLTQWPGSSRLELTPWFYLGSNEQHRLFYAST